MKNRFRNPRFLIPLGLVLTTTPGLLREFIHMPDFVRGSIIGLGIGLEIGGIILMRKQKKNLCTSIPAEAETE